MNVKRLVNSRRIHSLAVIIAVISVLFAPSESVAATVTVGGNFSVQFSSEHPAFQGVEEFTGEWSFTYDDQGGGHTGSVSGTLTGLHFFTIDHVFVDSPNITVGSTSFSATNMSVALGLNNGDIESFTIVGGAIAPAQDGLQLTYVSYVQNGITMEEVIERLYQVEVASAGAAGVNSVTAFDTSQGSVDPFSTYAIVPEPHAIVLSASGLLMIVFRRRRSVGGADRV